MQIIEIDFDFLLEEDFTSFKLLVETETKVTSKELQRAISCASNLDGETPSDFKCMICHELVNQHKLCTKCHGLFHESCLNDWS